MDTEDGDETTEPIPLTTEQRRQLAVELDEIAKKDPDGLIETQAVVDYGRTHPGSIIYGRLPWNDTEAAEAHRRTVARQIIRSVRVTVVTAPMTRYVNVLVLSGDGTRRRGYVPVQRAAADQDMSWQVIRDCAAAIAAWEARLQAFEKARPIVRSLGNVRGVIEQMAEERNED